MSFSFDKLRQLSRLDLGIDKAFHELKLVAILDTFFSLPWLIEMRDSGNSWMLDTTPAMAVIGLYHDLAALELV